MYKRELYLSRIRPFYNNEQIKILSGVRRCGKTEILKMIINELKTQTVSNHIIYLSLELLENDKYKDKNVLYHYLDNKINDDKDWYYLFLDEIQFCSGWSVVVNSIKVKHKNVSIFITGSNSSLLNDDKEGILGGRTISFHIMPFSYSEYRSFMIELNKYKDDDQSFDEYVRWGGFPLIFLEENKDNKETMLESIYDSIVLRDIVLRKGIKNSIYLNKVIDYLIASSSLPISGRSIQRTIAKDGVNISLPTIIDYLKATEESCLISLTPRYDVIGLRELEVNNKEYVIDPSFIQYKKSLVSDLYGSIYETIIYNDLISRGYQVMTGANKDKEIDFIVKKGANIIAYVQVAYEINKNNIESEFGNLEQLRDSYPKYVISKDKNTISRNGIKHLNIIDFLLLKEL